MEVRHVLLRVRRRVVRRLVRCRLVLSVNQNPPHAAPRAGQHHLNLEQVHLAAVGDAVERVARLAVDAEGDPVGGAARHVQLERRQLQLVAAVHAALGRVVAGEARAVRIVSGLVGEDGVWR
eukprot:306662-Chlamydomonas_euryale.AAC.1